MCGKLTGQGIEAPIYDSVVRDMPHITATARFWEECGIDTPEFGVNPDQLSEAGYDYDDHYQ